MSEQTIVHGINPVIRLVLPLLMRKRILQPHQRDLVRRLQRLQLVLLHLELLDLVQMRRGSEQTLEVASLLRLDQRPSGSFATCSSGSTDSVDVLPHIHWDVVGDDVRDGGDVDSSRDQVGTDETEVKERAWVNVSFREKSGWRSKKRNVGLTRRPLPS